MTNGNGTPTDLQGPLARMWRDVYAKAAGVAEDRTVELVHDHVYRYHPNGAGGGGGEGPFVDEAGDTMSGALIMRLPGAYDAGAQHGYGATTPAFIPASVSGGSFELGLRFRHPDGGDLLAVRWYRSDAGQTAPAALRLWDTTSTTLPVWSAPSSDLLPFLDTVVGWKIALFATPPALVAARDYVVSFDAALTVWRAVAYTPVPDSPLVVVANVSALVPESYPSTTGTNAYLLDPVVGQVAPVPPAAHAGTLRLQNGDNGIIAWRNAANTADHTLTVNTADQLVFDGVALGTATGNTMMYTQTTAPTGAANSLWFNPSESA